MCPNNFTFKDSSNTVRGCVHSTYARFWPFLTHPSPLYAFHTLRLDPSLSYIRNRLTHPPYKLCKCAFSKTLLNTFSYKEPFPMASWEEWVFLTFWTKLKSPTSLYYPPTLITPKKSWCPIETAKIQKAKKPPVSLLCTYAMTGPIHPSHTLGYAPWVPTHPSPLRTYYVHSPL